MNTSTVILGLGNVLFADEGIGVRAAQYLYKHYDFPPEVEIVDGGTQGIALLGFVEKAQRLLILDAVDFSLKPGTVVCKGAEEVPRYLTAQKHSVHQGSFSEVLALATLRGAEPQDIQLIGMQPVCLELGAALSAEAQERGVAHMVALALRCLQKWGMQVCYSQGQKELHHPSLAMQNFVL